MSVASRVILSNFFEEQWIENHPQYLSGFSRALFPTAFLEIAVYLYTHTLTLPSLISVYKQFSFKLCGWIQLFGVIKCFEEKKRILYFTYLLLP